MGAFGLKFTPVLLNFRSTLNEHHILLQQCFYITPTGCSSAPLFRSLKFLKCCCSKKKKISVASSDYKIFKRWCFFFFSSVDTFRNTNANWRRWPRFGRSCAHVWTVSREDSTTLLTEWRQISWSDLNPPATETSQPLSQIFYDWHCHTWFWKVFVFPCMVTCASHSVFKRWFIHSAFIKRCLFFVCELILMCCMLSVQCKQWFICNSHRPLMLWFVPISLSPGFQVTGWCWCDIFVFIMTWRQCSLSDHSSRISVIWIWILIWLFQWVQHLVID